MRTGTIGCAKSSRTTYVLHILQEVCLVEIRLHTENMLTILSSVMNTIPGI